MCVISNTLFVFTFSWLSEKFIVINSSTINIRKKKLNLSIKDLPEKNIYNDNKTKWYDYHKTYVILGYFERNIAILLNLLRHFQSKRLGKHSKFPWNLIFIKEKYKPRWVISSKSSLCGLNDGDDDDNYNQ